MCGIATIVSFRSEKVLLRLEDMVATLRHRGPDAQRVRTVETETAAIGFGHTRLAILDLSENGAQPMVCPQTGAVLCFNGEIYNYRELRTELLRRGHDFRGSSDSEALLRALVEWGPEALPRLAGMFAFTFHDPRRASLLVARDPLGIKPLYWTRRGTDWCFASEVRALRAGLDATPSLDRAAVGSFLAFGAVPEPRTILEGVRAFPRGASLELPLDDEDAAPEPKRYFTLPSTKPCDEPTAVGHVRTVIENSVREHLASDVPVGIFLSSGVDSTIVAGLAHRFAPDVRAFTVAFRDHAEFSEHLLAEASAKRLGLQHHTLFVDEADGLRAVESWLAVQDQPSMDGLNVFVLSQCIRRAGIAVALSGQGGDELFGGYPSFTDVPRLMALHRRLRWLPTATRRALGRVAMATRPYTVREKAADALASAGDVLSLYLHRRRTLSNSQLASLGVTPEAFGLTEQFLPGDAGPEFNVSDAPAAEIVSRLETQFYLGNMLLRDGDMNSMAHSLEVRVPFLDTRVVDTVFRFPASVRFPVEKASKHLLRRAFPEVLTPEIAAQNKRGFTLPIQRWMRSVLRDRCEVGLQSLQQTGLVRASGVRDVWERFLREPESPAWTRAWSLCVLGLFLREQTLSR